MPSETERYNSILQIIDDHLIPDETAKKERGEVFTPPDLVREMLFGLRKDKAEKGINEIFGIDEKGNFIDEDESNRIGGLPIEIWRNPNLKWLDPANGIGNFPVIAFYKLDYELAKVKAFSNMEKRRKHIIENMLYMIELDKGNYVTSKQIFKKIFADAKPNICCGNSLKMTFEEIKKVFNGIETFDIIMGNPPFNPPKTETGSSGNSIWQNFVMKSFYILNEDGYLCFVHPPGWKKPTDDIFKLEKFKDGDYTGQIRQGQIWQILKENGQFSFIYTNDQKSKMLKEDYLDYFPAVDSYIYQKTPLKLTCDTKNIFIGSVYFENNVKINYNLNFLPNFITSETQEIMHKLTSKVGEKLSMRRGLDERHIIKWSGKEINWFYDSNKNGFQYKKYGELASTKSGLAFDTVNINKVVMNFGGGIGSFNVEYVPSELKKGVLDMCLYTIVKNKKDGDNIAQFLQSDIVKFIFLITQYASGKMTKNEPQVANSITIPPEGIVDYYNFFGIQKYKEFIEDVLEKYKIFAAPKKSKDTRKVKNTSTKDKKGGALFNKTRKNRRF